MRAAAVAVAALATLVADAAPLLAQSASPARERSLEMGTFAHGVSDGFGGWLGAYARATTPLSARDVLTVDLLSQRAFRDAGQYAAVSLRHQVTSTVFVLAAGGAGTGRLALPQARADVLVGRAFGARRSVVIGAGASYVDAQALYADRAAVGSVAWYASPALVLELVGRVNSSAPGDVRSFRIAPALTRQLNAGRQALTLRADLGTEAYQLLAGPTPAARDFGSTLASAALRHRASEAWGATLQAEAYRNPYYTRAGLRVGVLRFW
jgi:YaiO family outer membrane protein